MTMGTTEQKIQLIMELRRQGISSARVLSAIETVDRDVFVSEDLKDRAYDNVALPIECGQTISQPYIVAYMTEKLELGERPKVLEIGTGSGYQAAVLSKLCRRVYTIERYRSLQRLAEQHFLELGISNVTTLLRDGSKGWPEQAPFDAIIVTAAARKTPEVLIEQLKIGGIMVFPVGESTEDQRLMRVVRQEEGWDMEELLPVRFVPLVSGIAKEL